MTGALPAVELFTDGACRGNPGPGGWAALMRAGAHEKELSGGEPETTNNRMEMLAAIEGLKALKKPSRVDLYTDSQYVKKGMEEWLPGWKRRGWRTADNKPVKNQDLWEELDRLRLVHDVTIHWIKGHAGHPENERVDSLARVESERF